jgi:hypothetical protein
MPEVVQDAAAMIAGMNPVLQLGEFAFCSVDDDDVAEAARVYALATFREDEGLSLLLPVEAAKSFGFATELPMRQITLLVYSSLEGIGLTAAVATALTAEGIPSNVVAATLHDHVFVPAAMAERAVETLVRLQTAAAVG